MRLMTADDFRPWLGRQVKVETAPYPIEMTLVEIEDLKIAPGMEREPYILYFETDWHIEVQDASYLFDCGRGGPYMIHISQMSWPGPRRRYQAVFG